MFRKPLFNSRHVRGTPRFALPVFSKPNVREGAIAIANANRRCEGPSVFLFLCAAPPGYMGAGPGPMQTETERVPAMGFVTGLPEVVSV